MSTRGNKERDTERLAHSPIQLVFSAARADHAMKGEGQGADEMPSCLFCTLMWMRSKRLQGGKALTNLPNDSVHFLLVLQVHGPHVVIQVPRGADRMTLALFLREVTVCYPMWEAFIEKYLISGLRLFNNGTFLVFPVFHLWNYNAQRQSPDVPPSPLTFFIWNGQEVTSVPYGVQRPTMTPHSGHKALSLLHTSIRPPPTPTALLHPHIPSSWYCSRKAYL